MAQSKVSRLLDILRDTEYVHEPLASYHAAKQALNARRGNHTIEERCALVKAALKKHRVIVSINGSSVHVHRSDDRREVMI